MLRIGLTGGIGSGKSTVARIFEVLGAPVYYADTAARQLMNNNETVKQRVIELFGDAAYENNLLNRKHIAGLAFKDPGMLLKLNAIVHPATLLDARNWLNGQTAPYAVKEAALIFEAGADKDLDMVIGVYAPEELRIFRTMQRDNISESQVRERMERQMDESEKMKRCDHIIHNDEQQLLIPQVIALHEKFMHI